jgi:hypothetical protein
MQENAVTALRFLSAPLGVAILTWVIFRYGLQTPDCDPTSTTFDPDAALSPGMCETRLGLEVPYTFDGGGAASFIAMGVGFIAGLILEEIQS